MAKMIDSSYLLKHQRKVKFFGLGPDDESWGYAVPTEIIENAPTLTQPNEGGKDKNVPTNEPLTLDDLRKIDTVTPLWVHDLSWGRHKPRLMLVRHAAGHYWSCVDFDGFEIVKADDYGSRYLIYRRPPEGEP